MTTLVEILLGLLGTFILGFAVKPLMACAKKSMPVPPPSTALAAQWTNLTSGNEGGCVLGYLERILFFGAFWAEAHTVIGAWLAFKVASKWNVWSNVISVPEIIEGLDPINYLIARRCWGSQLLMTFLIGTLSNVIIGFLGVLVGRYGYQLLRFVVCTEYVK